MGELRNLNAALTIGFRPSRSASGRTGHWYVAAAVGALAAKRTALALAGTSLALAGCGGGPRQDASEPEGTFPVDVVSARFPAMQHLARQVQMRVAVRNTGAQAVPDLALTVQNRKSHGSAFDENVSSEGSGARLADPSRPIWLLDEGPRNGDTAYVGTWTLGRLAPGKTKAFVFKVTPVRAGSYSLTYRVAAGLSGKAEASLAGGDPAEGSFHVRVSRTPGSAVTDTRGGG